MAFVSKDRLLEARNYVKQNTKKSETFAGLMLFIYCSIPYKYDGYLKKSNMKQFSELADLAFLFNEKELKTQYIEKEWFALFTTDWLENVKNILLNHKKISANDFLISLFWYQSYENIGAMVNEFKYKIGADIFEELFFVEENENPFKENAPCNRDQIYQALNGRNDNFTARFDNEFIKKRAGDLNAAPFSQTLYAGNDIKRILTIFDFDISEKLPIQTQKKQIVKQFQSLNTLPLPKPFLLLSGVSGTGKSRFVREQVAESERRERYQLVAVRPDWHEPSDLLGYVSRLSGTAQYVMTDVLKFIVKAWQAIENAGLIKNGGVSGNKTQLVQVLPYWLCLDEMNLAPVEQYFSDYLSILETREWKWKDDDFTYHTEALLSPTSWADTEDFQKTLDVSDELWAFFQQSGVGIPFNLIVAGTVNMDETTHSFSRKVLDRALSFDFSEFYPNDFSAFFEPTTQPKLLSYPIYSQLKATDLNPETIEKSVKFLYALNGKFDYTPFKLGYRALNELLLSIKAFQPKTDAELQAVWDDFIITKVLPRIEGDETKVGDVLEKIETLLKEQLNNIWENQRPDLWREKINGSNNSLTIDCRSKAKVEYMKELLKDRGMVSFW